MELVAKRLMLAVTGAGMGALVGLILDYLGGGNIALLVCAAAGAVLPLLVLGQPGH